jgi:hypothetical protein
MRPTSASVCACRLLAGEYSIELGAEGLGDVSSLETTLTVIGADKMLFSLHEARMHAS